jgi:4-azaleucine resistance transporter AzlC
MTTDHTSRRSGLHDGAVAVAPMLIGVVPFGLVFGIVAAGSSLGALLGGASSVIIFAGAAQLAMIGLIDLGTVGAVVVATALVINARHLMYSAALAPQFREFPAVARYTLPYLLTDQAFALSIIRFNDATDPVYKQWFFTGTAATLWVAWQISTVTGIVLGAQVPGSWSLDFAIPLVFLVLLVPAIKDRADLVAAIVGGSVAIAAAGAPYGLGLMIGAVCGIVAGVAARRVTR